MHRNNSKATPIDNKNEPTTRPANQNEPQRRRWERNYIVACVDAAIKVDDERSRYIIEELQAAVDTVHKCTNPKHCVKLLKSLKKGKAFIVTSGALSQDLIPKIDRMVVVESIYVLCSDKAKHEKWSKNWPKVKGIHTTIKPIRDALRQSIQQINQDSTPMSLTLSEDAGSASNLNQLEPSFVYTQLFKTVLLDMKHEKQELRDLVKYCQDIFAEDHDQLNLVKEFGEKYDPEQAIWWYTREGFIYQMLNQALRELQGEIIINMGFYICDVHRQIDQLYQQQVSGYKEKIFHVYLGQGLSTLAFSRLSKTTGRLMSFNSFLSTSLEKEVSLGFAQRASQNLDTIGIIFDMTIDPELTSFKFASIQDISYFKTEAEILFSMHTIFRIDQITPIGNRLYEVQLTLTSSEDTQLSELTARLKEENASTAWHRIGKTLINIGQYGKAEELYLNLGERISNQKVQATVYNQLGSIKYGQGDYNAAVWYYEQSIAIEEKILHENDPDLAIPYNNIAVVYYSMGEYSKALSYQEKALTTRQKAHYENHPDVAQSYNNIGALYSDMKEYSKALFYYEKAVGIYKKTLPDIHPTFATSYNNIGLAYKNMGDNSKALSYYEKAITILEKILPENHPKFATSYDNIAEVYRDLGEHSKALCYYEKALAIKQQAFPDSHSSLASSYNNIGLLYGDIGEHSKALSHYEEAIDIHKKTLSENHPLMATSNSNIAYVYENMGEYSKSLLYHKKAAAIAENTHPTDHPDVATAYFNLGSAYVRMKDYSNALLYFEKTLRTRQKTRPANHPDLTTTYNTSDEMSFQLKYYTKALNLLYQALQAMEDSLPPDHPDILDVRKCIKTVKETAKANKSGTQIGWKPAEKIKVSIRSHPASVKVPPIPPAKTIRSGLQNSHAEISLTRKCNLPTNATPRDHTVTHHYLVRKMNQTVKKPVGPHSEATGSDKN